jgi:tetratricopeptide (TPR) repeat protein
MSYPISDVLDQDELLQLACNAGAAGDSASAIAYLKEAVLRPDATGRAHYLLGVLYAQIRLYGRANDELESALGLDPTLSIARLQLGLLWLGAGAVERAASVLIPLEELPASDALRVFGAGLHHLICGEIDKAIACLAKGIKLNTENAPLNGDMHKILDELARIQTAGAQAAGTLFRGGPGPVAPLDDIHVLLSVYAGNTSH